MSESRKSYRRVNQYWETTLKTGEKCAEKTYTYDGSQKVPNYTNFATDDLDDDFHDNARANPKAAKLNERKDRRKRVVEENGDEDWSFEKSPRAAKKKRMSSDERRFERELKVALLMSQDDAVKTQKTHGQAVNPALVTSIDEIEVIDTVDEVRPSKRSCRGDNLSTTGKQIPDITDSSDSEVGEEKSSGVTSDEDFDPGDSDSDAKLKTRVKKVVPSRMDRSDLTSQKAMRVKHAPRLPQKSLDATESPIIPSRSSAKKIAPPAKLLHPPVSSTSPSSVVASPQTRTPKSTPTAKIPISPLTSPGLRLGLSRKQRVQSLHPTVTQIKT